MPSAIAEPRRRHIRRAKAGSGSKTVSDLHTAIREKRTLYQWAVKEPDGRERILKLGDSNPKLGDRITKGAWAGFPIWGLSLEERATCPEDCFHWRTCFANKMRWQRRWVVNDAFYRELDSELSGLGVRYPSGFALRLHGVGDFESVEYVDWWASALDRHPALHIWGYTHWKRSTAIGAAVMGLSDSHWDRFAVRLSDGSDDERCANTVPTEPKAPRVPEGIVCPEQTGKTSCCGTCGLCWGTRENIAFIQH